MSSVTFVHANTSVGGRVNLMKNIGNAYPKLLEQPVVPLSEDVAGYLKDYFALLSRASCNENFDMDPFLIDRRRIAHGVHLCNAR